MSYSDLQLQTAILNASSGVVQSLANQANIPASLLSSALINANMAATLSATGGVMNPGMYRELECDKMHCSVIK